MGVTAAVAAVVGTTYAVYSGEQAKDRQKDAMRQQEVAQTQQLSKPKRRRRLHSKTSTRQTNADQTRRL